MGEWLNGLSDGIRCAVVREESPSLCLRCRRCTVEANDTVDVIVGVNDETGALILMLNPFVREAEKRGREGGEERG